MAARRAASPAAIFSVCFFAFFIVFINVATARRTAPPRSPSRSVSAHQPFLTRGAQIFTNGGQPRVADWGELPFSGPAQSATVGCQPREIFLLSSSSASPDSQLWAVRSVSQESTEEAATATTTTTTTTITPSAQEIGGSGYLRAHFSRVDVTGGGAAALAVEGTVLRRTSSGYASAVGEGASPSLAFANKLGVFLCNATGRPWTTAVNCDQVGTSLWGGAAVNDVVLTLLGDLWIGTDSGLYYLSSAPKAKVAKVTEVTSVCKAVAFDDATSSVVAGFDLMWRRIIDPASPTGTTWHFFRTPGIIDANITALEFDADSILWVANDICVNKQHPDLGFDRVGGLEGLPVGNLTSLSLAPSGAMWLGSAFGTIRYLPSHKRDPRDFEDAEWQYFYGPRWLPGMAFEGNQQSVVSHGLVAWLDDGPRADALEGAAVVTAGGVALFEYYLTTLEEKAEHYQKIARLRHNRPPGLVAGVHLASFGNVSSFEYLSSDNDGLWTSIYLASQCFRYAVTKDRRVKEEAWHHFEALEFLNNVTGIHGLMARSVLRAANPPPHTGGTWHNSSTKPGWIWKGDTSSDEVTGHLFVYPLVHDLLAETTEEKQRARTLIYDITYYIQSNGWYLIDVTGKPTSWGKWAPKWLNGELSWYDERGVNALQILSWLLSAYRITGDQYFMAGFRDLVDNHGYGVNIINQKITEPDDDNFSDDELAYLPYYTWIHAAPPQLKIEFMASIKRAHRVNGPERSDLWDTIYAAAMHRMETKEKSDVLWTLRDWTWSLVDWPTNNSGRADFFWNPNQDRDYHYRTQSLRVLPYKERTMLRWNSNPYQVNGGSGRSESDPGAWLLPYWMARFHEFI